MTGLVFGVLLSIFLWLILFGAVIVAGVGVTGWIALVCAGVVFGFRNPQ